MIPKFDWLHLPRSEIIKTLLLPSAIVFVSFFVVTLWAYAGASNYLRDTINSTSNRRIEVSRSAIQRQFATYEEILRGGVGLFKSSSNVDRDEWKMFVDNFAVENRYPGIDGIGYSKFLGASEKDTFVNEMRRDGAPGFRIYPTEQRDTYTTIVYLEPMNERNARALGYDMFTEKNRRAAMEYARDSGDLGVTETVTLVQEGEGSEEPGFLIYMPLYKNGMPTNTVEQRRRAIDGFIYMPLRAADIVEHMLPSDAQTEVGVQIFTDPTQADESFLYENGLFSQLANKESYSAQAEITLHNTIWHINYRFSHNIVPLAVRQRPASTILWGGMVSIFTALIVYRLLLNRSQKLAAANEKALQLAKDDLLSLASHQLRTPATGVKQYIGMVLEGYAGDLNDDQKRFLSKAYSSNERQLRIINDLLFVAKADEGRIVISKSPTNISVLVKETVNEQTASAKDKRHKLVAKVPRKAIWLDVDAHSLRMALENLLTNAIKYTKEGGKITVTAAENEKEVTISVEDSGIGIKREDMHMLFKQFSRIPNELSAETGGSGIGLYLAQHLVQLHRGTINVKSKAGQGSTFTIRLPKANGRRKSYLPQSPIKKKKI